MKRTLALFGLLVFAFLLSACAAQKAEIEDITTFEAKEANGVQEVSLTWGKLNYLPEKVIVKKDIPVKIIADTMRLQGCFRSLVIPELGVNEYITEEDNIIEFIPDKEGEFYFSCSMGMGRGTLVVI